MKAGVAVIRGSTAGAWELQNFQGLERPVRLVTSRVSAARVSGLGLPVLSLPQASELCSRLPLAGLRWRVQRLLSQGFHQHYLLGLSAALNSVGILHSVDLHYAFSDQAARMVRTHGARLVVTRWENLPFNYLRYAPSSLRARSDRVFQAASRILATSRSAADSLAREGYPLNRVEVLFPGVDLERFRPGPGDPDLKARLGLPAEARVLLFVGRLTWEKGCLDLLEAFSRARDCYPDLACLMVGQGPELAVLREAAIRWGLGSLVVFADQLDYALLPAVHRLAEVFCLASIPTSGWEEQFGMVLAEALASGSAVLATRTGAIPEVVGPAGVLVPPRDVAALTQALLDLLASPGRCGELRAAARERAEALFGHHRYSRHLEAVYASL